jgi:hypothetical protein
MTAEVQNCSCIVENITQVLMI